MSHNQINCDHDWTILTYDEHKHPGVSTCNKCGLWLYHSNRLQLEMNRYVFGFQKKVAIVSIILSTLALIVSIISIMVAFSNNNSFGPKIKNSNQIIEPLR